MFDPSVAQPHCGQWLLHWTAQRTGKRTSLELTLSPRLQAPTEGHTWDV